MTMLRNRCPASAPSKPLSLRGHSHVSCPVDRTGSLSLASWPQVERRRRNAHYHVLCIRYFH